MHLGLTGCRAVVMAASRGLGFAAAELLAHEGCQVAICGRRQESVDEAVETIRRETCQQVLGAVVDVMRPETIAAFAAQVKAAWGHINILVNNSGGPLPGGFDELKPEDFQAAADLLLLNNVRTTKLFLPLLRARPKGEPGRILTITSLAAREPLADLMLSNSLRAAATGWSKSLANELAPECITVNCVAPGTIATERIQELIRLRAQRSGKPESEIKAAMEARIPFRRFGKPEEFASAVAFLSSRRASFISGTTLYVDGGQGAGL